LQEPFITGYKITLIPCPQYDSGIYHEIKHNENSHIVETYKLRYNDMEYDKIKGTILCHIVKRCKNIIRAKNQLTT
jgi:hypothetical protein